jgi:CheY-like chemotaxis protein
VISDIDMRDGTGFDLAAMLRDRFSDNNFRVVLVTGWIDANKQTRAHQAGCELVDKMYFSTDVLPMLRSLVNTKTADGIRP